MRHELSLRKEEEIQASSEPIENDPPPRGGFHAYRHGRVTILRKNGTPPELQTKWIGHSTLRITDGYDHSGEEVEYRQKNARKAGLGFVVGPNGPNSAANKNVA